MSANRILVAVTCTLGMMFAASAVRADDANPDLDAILFAMGQSQGAALVPGDLDGDGDVDNADLGRATGNFTGTGGSTAMNYADGDVDGDGDIDNADIGLINGAFTGVVNEQSDFAVAPTPTAVSAVGLIALLFATRRRAGS